MCDATSCQRYKCENIMNFARFGRERAHAGAYDFELGEDHAQLESLGSRVCSRPNQPMRLACWLASRMMYPLTSHQSTHNKIRTWSRSRRRDHTEPGGPRWMRIRVAPRQPIVTRSCLANLLHCMKTQECLVVLDLVLVLFFVALTSC